MAAIRNAYTQVFPPTPTFTEANIPPQSGRIFMVTGGNTGVGFEIIKILYLKGKIFYFFSFLVHLRGYNGLLPVFLWPES